MSRTLLCHYYCCISLFIHVRFCHVLVEEKINNLSYFILSIMNGNSLTLSMSPFWCIFIKCAEVSASNMHSFKIIICYSIFKSYLTNIKGTVSRDFLLLFFFLESVSPKPLIIPLGPVRTSRIFCLDPW